MTPLQILHDLAIKDNQTRFPNSWSNGKSLVYFNPKYTDKNEKGLVKCILDFLKFEGHQAERINNKGTRVDERQVVENVIGQMKTIGRVRWNYSQQERGTADISSTILKELKLVNGTSQKIGISTKWEIKIGKDTMKPAQYEYKAKIEKAGGRYFVVRDFSDFYSQYISFLEE